MRLFSFKLNIAFLFAKLASKSATQKPAVFGRIHCFGTKLSAKDIIGRLARIFKVDMTESYIYKKYSEMRMRGRNSRTYFMDTLIDGLNSFMSKQDQEG